MWPGVWPGVASAVKKRVREWPSRKVSSTPISSRGIACCAMFGWFSSRAEKKAESAVKAAFFTWLSYLVTVFLLVGPYLVFQADSPDFRGLEPHVQALLCTFAIGLLIVAVFNFYVSVVEEVSFKSRFFEMAGILAVVSLISYGIGIALRGMLGIEV